MLLSPWVTVADLPESRPSLPDAEWDGWCGVASQLLYALSGRRWGGRGVTTVTVRSAGALAGWSPASPLLDGSTEPPSTDVVAGTCLVGWGGLHDDCDRPASLTLADDNVRATGLTVTDRLGLVDPSAYRVDDGRTLVALTGRWAVCQGLSVRYRFGTRPPSAGRAAAAALAVELGRSVAEPDACRLPRSVTSISRQGVTTTLESLGTVVDAGRVGLPVADLWLRAVNPGRLRRRATVWTPELDRARRVPGTTVPVAPEETPAP